MLVENVEKKVELELVGTDGNAFALLGLFQKTAYRQGWTKEEVVAVRDEATSGDYNHLVFVLDSFCE